MAAESEEAAKAAAAMVQVMYEPLQVVTDALMAAKPGCIRVHDDTENDVIRFDNEKGNVAQGFAESDLIVEDDFYTPIQDHGYMEPDACMAKIEEDGRLLVCSSTQNVFHDLRMVCDITGLTEDQVHIVAVPHSCLRLLRHLRRDVPASLFSVVRNPWQQPINDMRSICM